MTDPKLPRDLLIQIEEAARLQNRKPDELLEEAVKRYLNDRSWVKILDYGRERGDAVGITTEEGIDRAIAESRKEHNRSGRS
jgi:hypothetical protein